MGRLMSWGLLSLHTVPFHTIPGSNLGSRKQKLQPPNSGLGNNYINLPYRYIEKKSVWRVVKYNT